MRPPRPPRRRFVLLLLLASMLVNAACGASDSSSSLALGLSLSCPAPELIRDDDAFFSFARELSRDVDRLLADPPATSPEHKRLLALRVHLALCLRDDAVARAAAEHLRDLQTDPGERAHSGVLTRALIDSQRAPDALERVLLAALQALPRDPVVRSAVQRSAAKIAALSEASLIAEIRDDVAPRWARGEPLTLEIADQIVRVGHRLRNILPLRAALLRAYDKALTTWP